MLYLEKDFLATAYAGAEECSDQRQHSSEPEAASPDQQAGIEIITTINMSA